MSTKRLWVSNDYIDCCRCLLMNLNYDGSYLEKEDMLSFDLHPSWWFGRKMDDTDYEWRFWADFFSQNMHWLLIHLIMGLAINHQLSKVGDKTRLCC